MIESVNIKKYIDAHGEYFEDHNTMNVFILYIHIFNDFFDAPCIKKSGSESQTVLIPWDSKHLVLMTVTDHSTHVKD